MKLHPALIAAMLSVSATASYAGGFVELPVTKPLPIATGNNQLKDPLLLPNTSTLSLLTSTTSTVLFKGTRVGSFIDAVYRDTTDNKLVFGGQLLLDPVVGGAENQAEVNDVFRSGFTGYPAAAAWAFVQPTDRGPTFVARNAVGLKEGALVFSEDVVDFRTDINVSEGNPDSALFLVKTDATSYAIANAALRLRQGGEEGQPLVEAIFAGYVPVTAAVPEPGTWLLMLSGLTVVAAIGRRRVRG